MDVNTSYQMEMERNINILSTDFACSLMFVPDLTFPAVTISKLHIGKIGRISALAKSMTLSP